MLTMTTDQIAGLALVYGTKAEQAKIFKQIKIATGDCCPNCGNVNRETLEDNGAAWAELTYLCVECGHQWDADAVAVDLPAKA